MVGPLLVGVVLLSTLCEAAVPADEVLHLPGLKDAPPFRHYSGYLNATGSIHLHYWFVESAGNPAKDPIILWLNGGPGCSSLVGMLNEVGPFHIAEDGESVFMNPYSWNLIANVLFLEGPAGVGYSYSDDGHTDTDDDQVSLNNHAALRSFFNLYPEYMSNDLYLFGESYAGVYIPTLAVRVAADSFFANFKGMGVGNGFLSRTVNTISVIYFAYYHGIIGQDSWNTLISSCCQGNETKCDFVAGSYRSVACDIARNSALNTLYLGGLNEYNLYQDCVTASVEKPNTTIVPLKMSDIALGHTQPLESRIAAVRASGNKVRLVPGCINATNIDKYMNIPQVRQALHIPDSLPDWEICAVLNYKELYSNMSQQFLTLLSQEKQLLVYAGDVDLACNFLGIEWFTDALQQPLLTNYSPWNFNQSGTLQVAGFYKKFKNLKFVTVKGGGHLVPQDKPAQAFEMFSTFLKEIASEDSNDIDPARQQ